MKNVTVFLMTSISSGILFYFFTDNSIMFIGIMSVCLGVLSIGLNLKLKKWIPIIVKNIVN